MQAATSTQTCDGIPRSEHVNFLIAAYVLAQCSCITAMTILAFIRPHSSRMRLVYSVDRSLVIETLRFKNTNVKYEKEQRKQWRENLRFWIRNVETHVSSDLLERFDKLLDISLQLTRIDGNPVSK